MEDRYTNLSKFEGEIHMDSFVERSEYIQTSKLQFNFISNSVRDFQNVLDIGASTGYSLGLFKASGHEVMGIEPSKFNKTIAREVYEVDLFTGMFDSYITEFPNNKYDLIVLSHVLEHIVNPRDFMIKVSLINSKYIYLEVPGLECKYVNEPFGHFCDEHVNHFTLESLSALMIKLGYTGIEYCMNFGLNTNLPAGFPSLMTLWKKEENTQREFQPIMTSSQYLDSYIKQSKEGFQEIAAKVEEIDKSTKLAVWGVGNHTSKLLGMTNLATKNIVKFYDNDSRKQKYSIDGKEIQPFSIKDIENGQVEKILISSYTANKAIIKELEKYNISERLILLYD